MNDVFAQCQETFFAKVQKTASLTMEISKRREEALVGQPEPKPSREARRRERSICLRPEATGEGRPRFQVPALAFLARPTADLFALRSSYLSLSVRICRLRSALGA